MRRLLAMPALAMIAVIRGYQLTLAGILPQRCRFHPSCSEYAVRALRAKGLIRGGAAAAWRVLRCGPWTQGGIDEVRVGRVSRGTARG